MAGTEILSKIGVGSGMNTTEIIEALVDADSAATKENLDNLEESTKRGNMREYFESNSFFYKKGRYIKSLLFSPSPGIIILFEL